MSEGLVIFSLVVAVLIGVGAASFLVMRSPAFWGDVVSELATKAWPQIWSVLSKRMTKEEEEAYLKEYRAGRGDEWLRRRRGVPRKD